MAAVYSACMKHVILAATLASLCSPALALNARDASGIACTIGKAEGEKRLSVAAQIDACSRWMETEPENTRGALASRAGLHERTGAFDLAMADYSASIAIRATAYTLKGRGFLHARLGQFEAAIADATVAIAFVESGRDRLLGAPDLYLQRAVYAYELLKSDPSQASTDALEQMRDDATEYLRLAPARQEKERAHAKLLLTYAEARLAKARP